MVDRCKSTDLVTFFRLSFITSNITRLIFVYSKDKPLLIKEKTPHTLDSIEATVPNIKVIDMNSRL